MHALKDTIDFKTYSLLILLILSIALMLVFLCSSPNSEHNIITTNHSDPLPSWHDGNVKELIINYVEDVTK